MFHFGFIVYINIGTVKELASSCSWGCFCFYIYGVLAFFTISSILLKSLVHCTQRWSASELLLINWTSWSIQTDYWLIQNVLNPQFVPKPATVATITVYVVTTEWSCAECFSPKTKNKYVSLELKCHSALNKVVFCWPTCKCGEHYSWLAEVFFLNGSLSVA